MNTKEVHVNFASDPVTPGKRSKKQKKKKTKKTKKTGKVLNEIQF